MPHFTHDQTQPGVAVALSGNDLARLETKMEELFAPLNEVAKEVLSRRDAPLSVVLSAEQLAAIESRPAVLSAEQFDELKALLQPGFELATLMLADYKAQRALAAAGDSGLRPDQIVDSTSSAGEGTKREAADDLTGQRSESERSSG